MLHPVFPGFFMSCDLLLGKNSANVGAQVLAPLVKIIWDNLFFASPLRNVVRYRRVKQYFRGLCWIAICLTHCNSKYTRRLEIAATQTKSAYADSNNLKPTEVGFVCITASSIRWGKRVFTLIEMLPLHSACFTSQF